MNIADITSSDFNDGKVVYHFDIERHSIPLKQFLATANATQDILDNFNEVLFDGKGEFELRVVAPEIGGLREILQVSAETTGVVILFINPNFGDSNFGKGFIEGLTGHEPGDLGEKLGEKLRDKVRKLLKKKDITDDQPPSDNDLQERINNIDDAEKRQLSALESQILVYMIVQFLAIHPMELHRFGFDKRVFIEAYKAKNSFYQACIDNEEVKSVLFGHDQQDEVFSVERGYFKKNITELPVEPRPENNKAKRSRPKM